MMRAMVIDFPEDPACTHVERQYMLGDDLLVAPVFSESGQVSYYVPDGTWTHLMTGEQVHGPRWVKESHGFLSLPLMVRPGSVIPVGAVGDRPDYDFAEGVTLAVFGVVDGAPVTTTIEGRSGRPPAVFVVSRRDDVVAVTSENAPAAWQILLVGMGAVGQVDGGTVVHGRGPGGSGLDGPGLNGTGLDGVLAEGVLVRADRSRLTVGGVR